MRVSDTERQRAIDELRRHCAAGRLDVDEYATRIEQALAATTLEDLDRVLGDLPMVRIADPTGAGEAAGYARSGRNGARRQLGAGSGLWSAASGQTDGGPGRGGRLAASVVVAISVLVVLGAVALAAVVGWSWAALLVAGWLLGLIQARLSGRGGSGPSRSRP